jgi:predicted Fe-Mo cluster-binding NifX family protein
MFVAEMEKVAIPIWQDRISPVLDTATNFLILVTENGREIKREAIRLPGSSVVDRLRQLIELGVSSVLCGAVSRPFHTLISQAGIAVYPWFTGDVTDVFQAYLNGTLNGDRYRLPGCGRGRRHRGQGRGPGRGRRRADNRKSWEGS